MNEIIIFCADYLIYVGIIYSVLHVFFKHERHNHIRHIVIILGTGFLSWVVAHYLKDIIANPRPDLSLALVVSDSLYSFPSGHTAILSALAFSMYGFDKRAGIIIFVLAILTGIARVLAGVHFWYDIVGGFVVGAIVAYLVFLFTKKIRS